MVTGAPQNDRNPDWSMLASTLGHQDALYRSSDEPEDWDDDEPGEP